ncbi:MAG: CpsB/CapC family capsule biosynthesis tyrosine phosphatase, partial [Bacillota bacterium]|nr:CpsB/CapC family capsule biosynthesis tyrosine phosphatase [Bacillota bacterium]
YLFNNHDISELCYSGTKYILSEFPYSSTFTGVSIDMLVRLIENFQVKPVFAHIERYPKVFKDVDRLIELNDMGVLFQANVSSILNFRTQRRILNLINDGFIHVLGTDLHKNDEILIGEYQKACDIIEKKCGMSTLKRLMNNAEIILNNESL